MNTAGEYAPMQYRVMTGEEKKVIFASSLGTVFEWYDFYLFGVMTAVIGRNFFAPLAPGTRDIFTLLVFAAGFAMRPFGALVFGRLGDLSGRKYTFLITIMIMGLSTFGVGFLPTYESWGIAAPILLIGLRLLQGLALGGEYGGAATYVAEHAPHGRRGFYTAWIQTTATLGLALALILILATRRIFGEQEFTEGWAWRVPYWASGVLLIVSVWIRLSLSESPAFARMKSSGRGSKAPITESFGRWSNLKIVILALFGLTAGQAVVWYTGQFYALIFLQSVLKVDGATANILVFVSLLLGAPFFIFFGWLSDRVGRKPIILAGCLLAAITYTPLFHEITALANPRLELAMERSPVTVVADPADCGLILNITGIARFTTSCDLSRKFLADAGVNYGKAEAGAGAVAAVHVGDALILGYDAHQPDAREEKVRFEKEVRAALDAAGYPAKADPIEPMSGNWWSLVVVLTVLVIYVTMVYGPIAALLVELFPTRIRYTSMSLPYHIGNGWFGGFLPAIAFAIVAAQGDIYRGLLYPIAVASMTFIVGMLFVRETKDQELYARD